MSDLTIGRMSAGMDESDFDLIPRNRMEMTANKGEGAAGDELDLMAQGDEGNVAIDGDEFDEESPDVFPMYNAALAHYEAHEPAPRLVRFDNENTYGDLVTEKAANEVSRRFADQDIMGAVEAFKTLSQARSSAEAADALPSVPLNLPSFAEGKVTCHRDGDFVIVSMRFLDAAGNGRVATAAAKPRVDVDGIADYAMRSGVDPTVVLGALPVLADVATGKRLVKDIAGAALEARSRMDVCGMDHSDEPMIMSSNMGKPSGAPLAALMHVQQLADAGNEQAGRELAVMKAAAATLPGGNAVVAPMLAESQRRLSSARKG
jgi:hypothetical protein